MRKGLGPKDIEKEKATREAFADFISGLLNLNPLERWSPQQARLHPFISGEKWDGPFTPPMEFKVKAKVPKFGGDAVDKNVGLVGRHPNSLFLPGCLRNTRTDND
jgi:serine/threonine protein kinase